MYLAPLNYDRFFKKVFKEKHIAKQFLEDFLDVKIQSIEKLDEKHRVTDSASIMEFDYRCKIDDSYVIIDMQQWYKSDIIKRFYLYHATNSSLQLEDLPVKLISAEAPLQSKNKKQRSYNRLEPVYTLIWMVDDQLGFKGDFAQYNMHHHALFDFINDIALWDSLNLEAIKQERLSVLGKMNNVTKDLPFLSKNKLVFIFQKNIVKNMEENKENPKYAHWFEFALKTRDKDNKKEDFSHFEGNEIFKEIIHRLKRDKLNDDDIEYIHDEDEYIQLSKEFHIEQAEKLKNSKKQGIEQGLKQGKLAIAKSLIGLLDDDIIAQKTGLSIEEINKL